MYTVYDFVNSEISEKQMKFGWKIDICRSYTTIIELKYTMLNFDWKSLEYIGDDLFNMFLNSASYKNFKTKNDRAMKLKKRLFFSACSIGDLKTIVSDAGFKIDIDKLVAKKLKTKSEKITEKLKWKEGLQKSDF